MKNYYSTQYCSIVISIIITVSIVAVIVTVVTDFLVVQLQSCQILSGLTELSFLHAFSDKPLVENLFISCNLKSNLSYQNTKALLAYMRSNLWSSLAQASMMAVVLDRQHIARWTLARSPPGTTVGGW